MLFTAQKGSNMVAERSESMQVDYAQINLQDDFDVKFWAEALGVTYDALTDLVRDVGPSIDIVDAALQQRRAAGDYVVNATISRPDKDRRPLRSQVHTALTR
jgi:hypothetical protein